MEPTNQPTAIWQLLYCARGRRRFTQHSTTCPSASDVAWDTIASHLIFVLRHHAAPQPIRLQVAHSLEDILVIIPRLPYRRTQRSPSGSATARSRRPRADYRPDIDNLSPVQVRSNTDPFPCHECPLNALLSGQRHGYRQRNRTDGSRHAVPYPQRPVRICHSRIYRILRHPTGTQARREPSIATQASGSRTTAPQRKRITYIALAKMCMPKLAELFLRFKDKDEIFVDGTVQAVLSAYAVPIKLKYECPPPSKFGKDPPLWKTATTCFLKVIKEIGPKISPLCSSMIFQGLESTYPCADTPPTTAQDCRH